MFYYKLLWVVICLQGCLSAKYLKEQPKWLKLCEKGMNNYPKCSTESIQNLFDKISSGIPEVGIPPFDPLLGLQVNAVQGEGPISIKISLKNLTIAGLANVKVLYNNVEFENNRFITRINIPKLRMDADYKSRGRLLIVPFNGDGKCFLEPGNIDVNCTIYYNLIKKKNFHFFNITSIDLEHKIGAFSCYFHDLFQGSRELSDGTNDFLNKNWEEAAEAFRPLLKKTNEGIFFEFFYKLLQAIPADFFAKNLP